MFTLSKLLERECDIISFIGTQQGHLRPDYEIMED